MQAESQALLTRHSRLGRNPPVRAIGPNACRRAVQTRKSAAFGSFARRAGQRQASSEASDGPAGRGAKALDQRLGAAEFRRPLLHVPKPGKIGVARLLSQRKLGLFEFLI